MIDFKEDSPYEHPAPGENAGLLVVGIGSAGVSVVDRIILGGINPDFVVAVDSDEQSVKGSVASEKLLIGGDSMHGFGAGGDPELASRAAKEDLPAFRSLAAGVRTAVVVTGLGGGTGTGAAPVLVRELKGMGARVIVFGMLPFSFQGERRMILAQAAAARLRADADAVLVMAADRLCENARGDLRGILHEVNARIGQVCLDLGSQLLGGGLIPVQLGQVKELVAGPEVAVPGAENTWLGSAVASGPERVTRLIEEVLQSPLLDDGTAWKHADAAVVCLTAGLDLPLAECEAIVEELRRQMPVDLQVIMGARLDPGMGDALSLSLLLTASTGVADTTAAAEQPGRKPSRRVEAPKTLFEQAGEPAAEEGPVEEEAAAAKEEPLAEAEPVAKGGSNSQADFLVPDSPRYTPQRYFSQQEEFRLDEKISRGRFEKTAPTIYNGQDLDVPTFKRLNMTIRL